MEATLEDVALYGNGTVTQQLSSTLAASMTGGWGILTDFWPQMCTGLSVVSSIYIVGSNWLNKVNLVLETHTTPDRA